MNVFFCVLVWVVSEEGGGLPMTRSWASMVTSLDSKSMRHVGNMSFVRGGRAMLEGESVMKMGGYFISWWLCLIPQSVRFLFVCMCHSLERDCRDCGLLFWRFGLFVLFVLLVDRIKLLKIFAHRGS